MNTIEIMIEIGWMVEDHTKAYIVFIPDNEYEIQSGYYTRLGLVAILRLNSKNADAITFIADMME